MNNTTKLGLLLPAVLNPATAAIVGIAAIAVGLYRMLPDDGEEATVDAVAANGPEGAVPTVEPPLEAVEVGEVAQVSELLSEAQSTAPVALKTDETPTSDLGQSEVIRKAMSELGKRSAAARAKKKAEREEQR
jgi:hypothetical protein